MPGPGRFTVVVADFLDETSVESPVLGEVADLVLCRAHAGKRSWPMHLPEADAIMLFHDIPHLGEASLRPRTAVQVRGPCRGRVTTTSTWTRPPGTA